MGGPRAPGSKFTQELVDRSLGIEFKTLPAVAIERAKEGIFDVVGVALAGWDEPSGRIIARHAEEAYGAGGASVIGSDASLAPMGAALANGTLAHALDFDDTAWSYIGHASAVLLPAALAIGEMTGATGRELIAAYVAGFEAASCVGRRIAETFATRGWHLTSTVGVVGAAAAAGRLLGFDQATLAAAFGLAATQAAGLKANFGSMAKAFHAGMASRSGVEAALLARAGLAANRSVFEDPMGFFRAFAGRVPEADGNGSLAIVTDGIAFKRYPSCTGSHPAVDALLELRREHRLRVEEVESITCETTPEVLGELLYPFPQDASQARFSMNFALAVALSEGGLGIEHFSDEMLSRPEIRRLMKRCETIADPKISRPAGVRTPAAVVHIRLTGGGTISQRVDSAKGNPADPLSREELVRKFDACAPGRLRDPGQVEVLREMLLRLEDIEDLRDVTRLASGPDRTRRGAG